MKRTSQHSATICSTCRRKRPQSSPCARVAPPTASLPSKMSTSPSTPPKWKRRSRTTAARRTRSCSRWTRPWMIQARLDKLLALPQCFLNCFQNHAALFASQLNKAASWTSTGPLRPCQRPRIDHLENKDCKICSRRTCSRRATTGTATSTTRTPMCNRGPTACSSKTTSTMT